jgi:predicted O-linked N-acetylglucosamine transferase (SPINDLY family)
MSGRLQLAFDYSIEVQGMTDIEVALLSRSLNIDIAVDLTGITASSRTGIFSYRAAPIQLNYLGYPGTLGADYMDYIIADRTLITLESQSCYSEKVVYLPNSYQVNDRKRPISDRQFTRQELGLPENGFVFCCFNNNFKILPATFEGWMRILKAVEGSVLWLFEDNSFAVENLKKEAEKRGIAADKLIFAERMPLSEHLARHRQADLFLDTLPYNAHTTTSDALWVGLPVLTLMGGSFASRVAASLLNAVGLPELITGTQEEYEALAIELALNPKKLADAKLKLANNHLTAPLFNTPLFTKNLEAAYLKMMERYQADMKPDHIFIA